MHPLLTTLIARLTSTLCEQRVVDLAEILSKPTGMGNGSLNVWNFCRR